MVTAISERTQKQYRWEAGSGVKSDPGPGRNKEALLAGENYIKFDFSSREERTIANVPFLAL